MRGFRTTAGIAVVVMLLSTMSVTIAMASTQSAIAAAARNQLLPDSAPIGASHLFAAESGDPVEIHALDALKFEPAGVTASPGQEIRVINDGFLQHGFVIDGLDMATDILDNGGEQTITVPEDAEPGEYTFYCPVPGHQAAGMKGTLTIVEAARDEPPAPAPALTGEPLFSADGIDAMILAQAGISPPDAGSTLLMELIELAPDSELPTHQATSPELFYVLSGMVTFRDNFGFASVVDAGRVVSLNAGTDYTIANTETEAGRLLRLRLANGAEAAAGATPAAASGDGATVLMQAPLDGIELDGAQMYLARAQFGANTDSGEQGHAGPLGIYVDSGAVNVVSPSGLVGAIEAGRAVSLPIETPLHASTGEAEAVVFLAGVTGAEGAPFAEISSGSPITEPGSVLEAGQTWRTETAEMTVDIKVFRNVTRFDFMYTNTGDADIDVNFDRSVIFVTDDRGGKWRIPNTNCARSVELAHDESLSCMIQFYPPVGTTPGPIVMTINVGSFGEIQNAVWQTATEWHPAS